MSTNCRVPSVICSTSRVIVAVALKATGPSAPDRDSRTMGAPVDGKSPRSSVSEPRKPISLGFLRFWLSGRAAAGLTSDQGAGFVRLSVHSKSTRQPAPTAPVVTTVVTTGASLVGGGRRHCGATDVRRRGRPWVSADPASLRSRRSWVRIPPGASSYDDDGFFVTMVVLRDGFPTTPD